MPKSRILLAVHHQGNRRVMAEWLSDQYEVIISNLVEYVPDKVDLCIVDYSLFQNSTANLRKFSE
jgi:hypothetical protein